MASALRAQGAPAQLVASWLTDAVGSSLTVALGPATASPVLLQVGCKQGGAATPPPPAMEHLVGGPDRKVTTQVEERGCGLQWASELGESEPLIWADSLFLVRSSLAELQMRVGEVQQAFCRIRVGVFRQFSGVPA